MLSQAAQLKEEAEARQRGRAEGLIEGRRKGKVAGLRQAADLLEKWGGDARENGDEFEGKANEEAAESLRQIADRLEEEG